MLSLADIADEDRLSPKDFELMAYSLFDARLFRRRILRHARYLRIR